MKVSLVVAAGTHEGRVIPITGSQFLIGRDPQCHLRPASQAISKLHCAVAVRDDKVYVKDFGSTTGTLVNDAVVQNAEVAVEDGAELRVGPLNFRLLIEKVDYTPPSEIPKEAVKPGSSKAQRNRSMIFLDNRGSIRKVPEDTPIGIDLPPQQPSQTRDGCVHRLDPAGANANIPNVLADLVAGLRNCRCVYVTNPTAVDLVRHFDTHSPANLDVFLATGCPVVAIDIAQHVTLGRFSLQSVIRSLFTQLVALHGLRLSPSDFHEQLIPQILKDEKPHLVVIYNIDPIDHDAIHYFRGLVQGRQLVVLVGAHPFYDSRSVPVPTQSREVMGTAASDLLRKYMRRPR